MRLPLLRPLTSSLKTCTSTSTSSASKTTRSFPVKSVRTMSSGIPSETAKIQKEVESQQSAGVPSASELGIENTNIKTATGVELSDEQKVIVGSVLDLFAGRPSLKKLQLWKDDAVFQDNITKAEGRKQYEPQWYGLQSAFSSIERLSQSVTSSGNPIEMDMATKYKLKGTGTEKTINSKIRIYTEGGKITEVQDRWDGELPDGIFAKAMRNLNSVTVPAFVGVPKNEEEDAKRGN